LVSTSFLRVSREYFSMFLLKLSREKRPPRVFIGDCWISYSEKIAE
jgi:hypothetical protein